MILVNAIAVAGIKFTLPQLAGHDLADRGLAWKSRLAIKRVYAARDEHSNHARVQTDYLVGKSAG